MSINHQQPSIFTQYGGPMQQQTPQVIFDFVNNPSMVDNYLVAPGNTCYFLDKDNKKLYEKTYESTSVYDLSEPQVFNRFSPQQSQSTGLTKEEVSAMIAEALSQYNPHIPKKERKNNE